MTERILHPAHAPRELPALIETLAVAECLSPGQHLVWMVPVLGDAPLINNSTNGFVALDPAWPRGWVRLSHFLRTVLERGGRVTIQVLDSPSNRQEAELLQRALGPHPAFTIRLTPSLPFPGWYGEDWLLAGRARWTAEGIQPEETLRLDRDRARIEMVHAALISEVVSC